MNAVPKEKQKSNKPLEVKSTSRIYMEEEEEKSIELRSEEVQEILGTPPRWIIRWGTTVAFLVVLGIIFIAWAIKYPDIRHAKISLTTEFPPSPIIAKASGNLEQLHVSDKQKIKKGMTLGVLQSTASFEDIAILEEELKLLEDKGEEDILDYEVNTNFTLGEIAPAYNALMKQFADYKVPRTGNLNRRSIGKLISLKNTIDANIAMEENKKNDLANRLTVAKEKLNRIQQLYPDNASQLQVFNAQDVVTGINIEIKNANSAVTRLKGQKDQIDSEIIQIESSENQLNSNNFNNLQEAIDNIHSEIDTWKEKYVLTAPIDGMVSFRDVWFEKEYITIDQPVMFIIPEEGNKWIGQLNMPTIGSGKVDIGQRVIVKFDSYPYMEFGVVEGTITNKATLPSGNKINVQVGFPNGLTTSYGRELDFAYDMKGSAEIITEEKRFLHLIFDKLISRFRSY